MTLSDDDMAILLKTIRLVPESLQDDAFAYAAMRVRRVGGEPTWQDTGDICSSIVRFPDASKSITGGRSSVRSCGGGVRPPLHTHPAAQQRAGCFLFYEYGDGSFIRLPWRDGTIHRRH
jgi:hypothetical protein